MMDLGFYLWLTHDGSGFLSMANHGPHKNGSQFLITFKAAHHLDGKHVVFGKLVLGRETVKKISEKGKPECTVKIVNCREHLEGCTRLLARLGLVQYSFLPSLSRNYHANI